jgi:uridine kinase
MERQDVLQEVADRILAVRRDHPVRVGIDGVDAAGKTCFANELAPHLEKGGRNVIRASIDGFHHPKEIRIRQGALSAEGYYRDSFDYPALTGLLLEPLGPQGSRRYHTATFDFKTENVVSSETLNAGDDDILVFEGVFLFRPEIDRYWDFRVFLEVSFETNLSRALKRDSYLFGTEDEILRRYRERYIPGQQIYLENVMPQAKADVLIDNNDFEHPRIMRHPGG